MGTILKRRLQRLERGLPIEQVNAIQEILTQALRAISKDDLDRLCEFLERGSPYLEYKPAEKAAMERYTAVAEATAWRITAKSVLDVGTEEYVNVLRVGRR